jgi:intracellular septation protein
MKLLFDFFPVLVFFLAYKLSGLFVATGLTMLASVVQVSIFWLKYRRFEKMHMVTLVMVLLLGAATLWFRDPLFIKWKPTAIYWLFAVLFLGSHFFGKKNILQHMMGSKIELSSHAWRRLSFMWVAFFFILGIVNVFVLYQFSTDVWVNFKLFGTFALMFIFVLFQAFYITKHLEKKKYEDPSVESNS